MQISIQNGRQQQNSWANFEQHIFRSIHHKDLKFIHNISYIVLYGMMKAYWTKIPFIFFIRKKPNFLKSKAKLYIRTHSIIIPKQSAAKCFDHPIELRLVYIFLYSKFEADSTKNGDVMMFERTGETEKRRLWACDHSFIIYIFCRLPKSKKTSGSVRISFTA